MWFRFRLAWMAAVFGLAVLVAMVLPTIEHRPAVLISIGERWGLPVVFLVSGVLCVVAFMLRVWSEALLAGVVYGQRASAAVVVVGPFAFTRNPLYIGTWLFFVASMMPYLPVIVLVPLATVLAALLRAIVINEEAAMTITIGEPFAAYCRLVPRFLGVRTATHQPIGPQPRPTTTAWLWGIASNIFLLTLGLYRVAASLSGASKALGIINIVGLVVWLVVVLARRARAS